jgi:hypothetical protein
LHAWWTDRRDNFAIAFDRELFALTRAFQHFIQTLGESRLGQFVRNLHRLSPNFSFKH